MADPTFAISKVAREQLAVTPKYRQNSARQEEYQNYVLDLHKSNEVWELTPGEGDTTRKLTLRFHAANKRLRQAGVIPENAEFKTVTVNDKVRVGFTNKGTAAPAAAPAAAKAG